ncbi:MAG: hypothetical protein IJ733_13950, partial [Lachnospiraceae bacterium]|nr:hypothetical protein [Lachnospiraceae bacterium]
MDGSFAGNDFGVGYYVLFLLLGTGFVFLFWRGEKPLVRILLGSVAGTIGMIWFPLLFSFFGGFTIYSHIAGLVFAVLGFLGAVFYLQKTKKKLPLLQQNAWQLREYRYLLIVVPLFIFFALLLNSHTIPYASDGSMHAGQASYGDMNMHLSFITSIARQGKFPPDYSMLPGTRLAYPFLCDSISSSIYLFGSSLRTAYMFPMLVAVLQLMLSVLLLGRALLKSRGKAMLAWVFFFFNGGLGFLYFIPGVMPKSYTWKELFEGFYITPTNLIAQNVRWSNVVIDMLLPQRATLFGWSVLVPAVYILYRGVSQKRRNYFIAAAIFAGALPMIHTHSFLAMGMICAMWLIYSVRTELNDTWLRRESKIELLVVFFFFFTMCLLDVHRRVYGAAAKLYFGLGIAVAFVVVFFCIWSAVRGIKRNGKKSIAVDFGILLGIVLLLALPQLIFWTFGQVNGDGFLRGYFNWANQNDTYLVFYLKNMGIVWGLGLIALIFTKTRNYFMAAPVFFIWTMAELIVFQPNEYDNNKLLYIAYLLLCMFVADYVMDILKKIGKKAVTVVSLSVILFFSSISALLTFGREYVSDYELYSADEVKMCKYIEKHTKATDVILTDTRHNNGVVSLTGRN